MTNQELFSQAIADAKAVRDAAVANAKAALEETFTPKIMSMLSTKLQELEEEGLEEGGSPTEMTADEYRDFCRRNPNDPVCLSEKKDEKEEGYGTKEEGHEATIGYGAASQKPQIEGEMEEGNSMEETDLEEILAQLEAEEKEGEKVEEKKEEKGDKVEEKKDEKGKNVEEAKEEDEDKKKKVEESLEEAEGDEEVTELTVDELKDIIRDVLKDVMAGVEDEEGEGEIDLGDEEGEEEETKDEESVDLDELLAELAKEEDKVEEAKEKKDEKNVEEAKEKKDEKNVEEAKKEADKAKKDLDEAISTIKTLQAELNEVNLLNAKLLYTNKIFKARSLNEAQKVKVLKAFDKATTVNEVKTVYTTLSESLSTKTKTTIKESVGFASKAAGIAPAQPIVESDAAIRRMQQLAGIIK